MSDFLCCEWRKLAVANYTVSPSLLQKYLPYKTELDLHLGLCYVSLVGFKFCDTKTMGIRIPFHINFEEVNLRFYVRHLDETGAWKRGVVFIKEIVPKPALTFIARTLYGENYVTMPMKHKWSTQDNSIVVEYAWKNSHWNNFKVEADATPLAIKAGSEEEFILEHYWGYTKINNRKTFEYQVEHPTWQIYAVKDYEVKVSFGSLYGEEFGFLDHEPPASVFLAEGSAVKVKSKRIL